MERDLGIEKADMRHLTWVSRIVFVLGFLLGISGIGLGQDLPVIKGKKTVAVVNGEPITLSEFNQEGAGVEGEKRLDLLQRLINSRLMIQEARRMGIDQLKELKDRVDVFAKVTLRERLLDRHIRDIKADGKEVEKVYRESIRELKIKSIFFDKEEDAKQMEGLLKDGKDFDGVLGKFLSEKKGKGSQEGVFLKNEALLPEIAEAVSKMNIGSVSPVIPIKSGYVVFKIEDVRFPDDPEIRKKVELDLRTKKQQEAISKYSEDLKRKYAKVNEGLLKGLDFESKEPGFDQLMKDKRVVAEIKGEKPITVGEFTNYMRQQLYHGVEMAVESKRLNNRKSKVLDEMIQKRTLTKEALLLGLDKKEEYKNQVKEYENSIIFDAFIQKAVIPDIKLKEEEIRAYYDQHINDYTHPEMMKMSSLVFANRGDAEKAIVSLRGGADFQWVKENEKNQVSRNTVGILNFDGRLLTTKDLPEEARKAVSGGKEGDFKLYESPDHYFYVLYIQEVVPSRPQPYDETKGDIARKMYNEKLIKAVEEYADKLRAVSNVKIYLKS
jgi:parvulin-like peptidyl-prolyl isomerase